MTRLVSSLLVGLASSLAIAHSAPRTDTPSGLPVPRFVSIKAAGVQCRSGPSRDHPVSAVFQKGGAPVLVVAETKDHWRKIRDHVGDECWAHQSVLSAVNHAIVRRETALRVRASHAAPVRARLAEGVLVRLDRDGDNWRRVRADDLIGYAEKADLWGAEEPAF